MLDPVQLLAVATSVPSTPPTMTEIKVRLKTVTPILNGGTRTRKVDKIDVIRVPTVRGHLRFWWRALYGHTFKTADEMYDREAELWGGASGNATRSKIVISIEVDRTSARAPNADDIPQQAPTAYALWVARQQQEIPAAERYPANIAFQLSVCCPKQVERQVGNAIRAWVLFGGYGSRTRRGVGALTMISDRSAWLPRWNGEHDPSALAASLTSLFGANPFDAGDRSVALDTPKLDGASMLIGQPVRNAEEAWATAVNWLRDFRQSMNTGARQRPPKGAPEPNRPSRSNWPEADVARTVFPDNPAKPYQHRPRCGAQRAYPRASFGLPLQTRFNRRARGGGNYNEPRDYMIVWHDGQRERDRLSSALVVKPIALQNGQFAPCALWLTRGFPSNGRVVIAGTPPQQSGADFDAPYVAAAGVPRFIAEAGDGEGVREAFVRWLDERDGVVSVFS